MRICLPAPYLLLSIARAIHRERCWLGPCAPCIHWSWMFYPWNWLLHLWVFCLLPCSWKKSWAGRFGISMYGGELLCLNIFDRCIFFWPHCNSCRCKLSTRATVWWNINASTRIANSSERNFCAQWKQMKNWDAETEYVFTIWITYGHYRGMYLFSISQNVFMSPVIGSSKKFKFKE